MELPQTDYAFALLNKLAYSLDLPVEAFYAPAMPHVFHADERGDRWVLVTEAPNGPRVRHLTADGKGQADDIDVLSFLIERRDAPEGRALAAFVNDTLNLHLRLARR